MSHESIRDDHEARKAAKRIQEAYRKLEAIVNGDDDLMVDAERRRSIKKAALGAKKVYDEHRLAVFIAEAVLVVLTFGVALLFRHRKKSS